MVPVPPQLGAVGQSDGDAERLAAISDHVHAVMKHRGLTPAEQVTVLVQLATAIVALRVRDPVFALRFLAGLSGQCFAMAQRVHAERGSEALRDAPPGGARMTARLVWQRELDGAYAAVCGEEGQGRVRVFYRNLAWEWSVDMLPDDAEPKIRSAVSCRSAFDAMAKAQQQVEAWPALIEGARR